MKSIELNVQDIIDSNQEQERGMILAERATKATVVSLIMQEEKASKKKLSKQEAGDYLKENHPEYHTAITANLEKECRAKYPKLYKKAMRWLNNNANLINAWPDEILDFYCMIKPPVKEKKKKPNK